MAILITGPSSVGKSTFMASEERQLFGATHPNAAYGFQIAESGFAPDTLVHYNLLHQATSFGGDYAAANALWDFAADPVFSRIVDSGLIESCIVLVAPMAELLERIEHRTGIETFLTDRYDSALWLEITRQIDLPHVYERLFSSLDALKIPFRVLLSSAHRPQRFSPSDRLLVLANLNAHSGPAPAAEPALMAVPRPAGKSDGDTVQPFPL
ncbi:MAG: hypothetical protein Q8J92_07705 [Parvibaculum sp.]|nr:hypothetical protein [Parvibaculum sp.]